MYFCFFVIFSQLFFLIPQMQEKADFLPIFLFCPQYRYTIILPGQTVFLPDP